MVLGSLRKTLSVEDSCLEEAENVQWQVSCFCLFLYLFCPCEFLKVYYYYCHFFTVILVEAEFKEEDKFS